MAAATVWLLNACSANPMENVSERRSGYYKAECEKYSVVAVSGVRETPYASDGKAGALVPYTLITLTPKTFDVDALYTYTAEIGTHSFGGSFVVHPFAASFSAEFEFEATSDFTVAVKCGDDAETLSLVSALPTGAIGYDRAIDAAKTELKPSGGYEIRARLITNPLGADGLCWHVAFITSQGQTGALIDPLSAKILAKK